MDDVAKIYYPGLVGFKSETVAGLFLERCERTPDKIAYKNKKLGVYKDITWQEYWDNVEDFGLGLTQLGLHKGDRVAIMGDTCIGYCYAELACICTGAVPFGIYPTASNVQVLYYMENAEATFFIAEDQEYVDKILTVADKLPDLQRIVVIDTSATFMYSDPRLISFDEVSAIGAKLKKKNKLTSFRNYALTSLLFCLFFVYQPIDTSGEIYDGENVNNNKSEKTVSGEKKEHANKVQDELIITGKRPAGPFKKLLLPPPSEELTTSGIERKEIEGYHILTASR